MEKYSNLKSLSGIIIFFAWITLIAGIIIAISSISEDLELIMVVTSVVSGFVSFILLLSFGKLIQVVLDIRENQLDSKGNNLIKEIESETIEYEKEIEFSETVLLDLRKHILHQKKSLINKNKNEILELLSGLITSKQESLGLIAAYEKYFGLDLIEELKGLSTNYGIIREYLEPFIKFDTVGKEYPHEMVNKTPYKFIAADSD